MKVTRRQFLRATAAVGGALTLRASGLLQLQKALAAEGGAPPVIWLQGQSCTGCAVSFLNSVYYATADDLLINELDVRFQSNVMAAAGDLAVESAEMTRSEGGYILVVEGSTPAGANGEYCHLWEGMTMLEAMKTFAPGADIILAFGTCASYGGIYAAAPNPTEAMGVRDTLDYLGLEGTVINIPGCPAHPDWL
ncbi:MAG: NADH-quinone oxidoreductase subunit B family protein, partial [Planctomycetota bacterium]